MPCSASRMSEAVAVCEPSDVALPHIILQGELGYEGQHEAFALALCEAMATLGSQHLGAISKPGGRVGARLLLVGLAVGSADRGTSVIVDAQ